MQPRICRARFGRSPRSTSRRRRRSGSISASWSPTTSGWHRQPTASGWPSSAPKRRSALRRALLEPRLEEIDQLADLALDVAQLTGDLAPLVRSQVLLLRHPRPLPGSLAESRRASLRSASAQELRRSGGARSLQLAYVTARSARRNRSNQRCVARLVPRLQELAHFADVMPDVGAQSAIFRRFGVSSFPFPDVVVAIL